MASDVISTAMHVMLVICFATACAGNFGSIFGCSWWKFIDSSSTFEFGILRECLTNSNTRNCSFRKTVFTFNFLLESEDLIPDIILSLFFVATACNCVTLLCSVSLLFLWRKKKAWRTSCVTTSILGLIGGQCNVSGMAYAQISTNKLSEFKPGWTFTLSWVSTGCHFLAASLSYLLLCFPPANQVDGKVIIRNNNLLLIDNKYKTDKETNESKQGKNEIKPELFEDKKSKSLDERGFVMY